MSIQLLPTRLRRQSRVTAIQCGLCGQWCIPRHIRIPAIICRDCEAHGANQTWKPSHPRPAHLGHLLGIEGRQ